MTCEGEIPDRRRDRVLDGMTSPGRASAHRHALVRRGDLRYADGLAERWQRAWRREVPMDTTISEQHESEIRGYCRAYPTVFASASNARQVDEDGTSYIDFFAGAGVLNFGHNNPAMKEAMIEFLQADGVA